MNINFDLLRKAATDDNMAKILRLQWQLDQGSDGSVVCSRADIEAMLANGTLEPVLTVEQFVRISRGKAYGACSATSPAPASAHAVSRGKSDGQWESHPDWNEYKGLSEPMKRALHHDFRSFLFVKRRGALASLAHIVGAQIESTAAERVRVHDLQALEQAVQDAPLVDADRFNAALARVQGNRNYPGLQQKRVR